MYIIGSFMSPFLIFGHFGPVLLENVGKDDLHPFFQIFDLTEKEIF